MKSGMTIAGVGAMALGVLVLLVAYTIIPVVGSQLDLSVTLPAGNTTSGVCVTAGCQWNASVNTAIPTAVDTWESLGGILKVAALITIVGGFLTTLKGLRS